MDDEYILILTPGDLSSDEPNVDSECYKGTKEEMEELFNSAVEDSEFKTHILLVKIIKKAELVYTFTETADNGS